ncbi:hypothetical protein CDHC01_0876 [Corynebacterium diphtheriae HC01]|nr:hypothetical protein [Corynebacterium diphtheriae]AEX43941.1 hypothetical protein CD241_0876 [Corynebacterium diphtheriae 241]AEX74127.1 hypothetical protein CDHC01_0876 [Corynebacterium diphtheriae HC01]
MPQWLLFDERLATAITEVRRNERLVQRGYITPPEPISHLPS